MLKVSKVINILWEEVAGYIFIRDPLTGGERGPAHL